MRSNPRSSHLFHLFEDRRHPVWQRIRAVCLFRQRTGRQRPPVPTTADGCDRGGTIHAGPCLFFGDLYRLTAERLAWRGIGHGSGLSAVLRSRGSLEPAVAGDAPVPAFLRFPGWGQRRLHRHHRNGPRRIWPRDCNRLAVHPDRGPKLHRNIRFPLCQQRLGNPRRWSPRLSAYVNGT